MNLPYALRQVIANLPRGLKQAIALTVDGVLLYSSFHAALWLRFELFFFSEYYFYLSLIACVGGLLALSAFGAYRYILRYMNERVAASIAGGVTVSVMLVVSLSTFLRLPYGLSRGVLVLYGLLSFVGLIGTRLAARRLLFPSSSRPVHEPDIPVVIYGAGAAGSQLAAALAAGPHYRPIALIDDDPAKHRLVVVGLRIYPPSALSELIERHAVRQLLIAMPSASPARIRDIVESHASFDLRVRLVPSLREMVDIKSGLRLRDIRVEDLLGRNPVPAVPALLGRCVAGQNVMVTGAGGSIGSELCRQILAMNPTRLVLYEISEPALYAIEQELSAMRHGHTEIIGVLGSVRDEPHINMRLHQHEIQTIYHAAAYKHVPIVERNIGEGLRTNAIGTHILAKAALNAGVADFVLISTDKAVRPTNIMGTSKRLAELVLQGCAKLGGKTRFTMVRFGNVLGSSGSVVPLFHKQILAGGPITLTHPDITRYFMTIPEAAQLVLQAGSMGESGSVYVLDMGEPILIRDLARKMVRLYGLTIRDEDQPDGDIEITVTGLRPGEKLYEELLIGDDAQPTEHPRIMRAREHALPYADVCAGLADIEAALDAEPQALIPVLKRLVPEYLPAHSDLTKLPQAC